MEIGLDWFFLPFVCHPKIFQNQCEINVHFAWPWYYHYGDHQYLKFKKKSYTAQIYKLHSTLLEKKSEFHVGVNKTSFCTKPSYLPCCFATYLQIRQYFTLLNKEGGTEQDWSFHCLFLKFVMLIVQNKVELLIYILN